MRYLTVIVFTAVLLSLTAFSDDADGQLDFEFDTAVAAIAPRSTSKPISLPTLTFALRAEARCPALLAPESVSISIADTRITIKPETDGALEKSIRVAEKQLGPLAVEDFCLADNAADAGESLQVDDALSAQLSLRCVGEDRESISYQTAALSVTLQCETTEPESSQTSQ